MAKDFSRYLEMEKFQKIGKILISHEQIDFLSYEFFY